MNTITVYNHGNLPTAKLEDFKELQEDFKIYDAAKNAKLQMLIITRGFKYAFKAWKDQDGQLWIIDAHQRKRALQELKKSGFEIPEIPFEPIHAENKRDAVQEIAAYNSEFGTRNSDTKLFEKYNIGIDELDRFNLDMEHEKLNLNKEREEVDINDREVTESDVPEFREKEISKPGDVWRLDCHRVMCGSSTKQNDVLKLMNGRFSDLTVTDPPYNVDYTGGTSDALTIQNDKMDNDAFYQFLLDAHKYAYLVTKDGGAIYVFHADSEGFNFRAAFINAGFKLAQCLIWVKNSIVMGRQDYQWKHEPILYGWKPTAGHNWYSDRKQSTVINFDRPIRNDIHPTMKPVGLIGILIKNSSKKLDIVTDFFGGSGSTLMACAQLERIARVMELDPKYVDVEVRRYLSEYPDADIRLLRDNQELTLEQLRDNGYDI